MTTPRLLLTALLLSGATLPACAQTTPALSPDQQAFRQGTFQGATADKAQYKAIYQLNTDDARHIKMTLRNIRNALADPRLQGRLEVELVAFSGGIVAFRRDQPYEAELRALLEQGVILAQCLNTMRERNVSQQELWPFLAYVPSGNGELIIRQGQGWALVHP
ncbi:DsrE family protein [Hymenobacter aerophilus]|uniref:DsrE family protein n=1 Tax=Hymenobacter aerophilus TaxID=119644 RepID=UPI000526EB95|nr:DsrE family protein [Hymenobacter aerophilus]